MEKYRILFVICGFLFNLLFVACTPTVDEGTVTMTATNEPIPTATAVSTNTPPPTVTSTPETAVFNIPYQDDTLGLSLTYPRNWQHTMIGNNTIFAVAENALSSEHPGSDGAVVHIINNRARKLDAMSVGIQLDALSAMFGWGDSFALRGPLNEAIIRESFGWTTVADAQNNAGDPLVVTLAFNFGNEGFGAVFVGIAPQAEEAEMVQIFAEMIDSMQVTLPAEVAEPGVIRFDPALVVRELESGVVQNGRIAAGQPTFWQFSGQQDDLITMQITSTVPYLDTAVDLFNAEGESVLNGGPWDSFFAGEEINHFPLPSTDEYFLGISSVAGQDGDYALQMTLDPPATYAYFEPTINRNGIQFAPDSALGSPVWFIPPDEPYKIAIFSFADPRAQEDPAAVCWRERAGCITIYDLNEYAADFEGFAHNIELIQTAIANQKVEKFPTIGAAVLMQSQIRPLTFQNGSGFRGIVTRGQAAYVANNESIVYDFHGITDDGQTYINIRFPVAWVSLIDSYDPATNTNENALMPPDPLDDNGENVMGSNRSLEPLLDVAPNSEFTPDLSLLDALVESIIVDITTD